MKRLARPAWLFRHVLVIALVITFLRLGWWQLSRAKGGNGLSIGYTLEWPAFAIFVIVVWAREVRTALGADRPAHPESPVRADRHGGEQSGEHGDPDPYGSGRRSATGAITAGTVTDRSPDRRSPDGRDKAGRDGAGRGRAGRGGVPFGVSDFDLEAARAERAARARRATDGGSADYNDYLTFLAAHPNARPIDYRTRRPASRRPATSHTASGDHAASQPGHQQQASTADTGASSE